MKKMSIFLTLCACFLIGQLSAQSPATKLSFGKNGKFKIVQFTDIHWEAEVPESESEAVDCMNKVLDIEKPDFVIFTGDQTCGEKRPAREVLEKGLLAIYKPVIDRKIPFAFIFGNHDREVGENRETFEFLKSLPGNLTRATNDMFGVTNFDLPIYSRKGDQVAFVLYCFDRTVVEKRQVDWYVNKSLAYTEQNNKRPIPSLVFTHVPLEEVETAITNQRNRFYGHRGEAVAFQRPNSGAYKAFIECGDIIGIFCGHDHLNDFSICIDRGPLMVYGRVTGGATNTYYRFPDSENGARVIELEEGVSGFYTWLRISNGEKQQALKYPFDFIDD